MTEIVALVALAVWAAVFAYLWARSRTAHR